MEITLIIERIKDWWDVLGYKGTPEYRQMIHEQLEEHDKAMKNGTESPYFPNV